MKISTGTALLVMVAVGGSYGGGEVGAPDQTTITYETSDQATTAYENPHNLTLFQRVSVEGLLELLTVAQHAEPLSCWCQDPNTTDVLTVLNTTMSPGTPPESVCSVTVPSQHLQRVLKKTCLEGHVHCCLPRVSQLRRDDLISLGSDVRRSDETINNNTVTLNHLNSLVDTLADTLTPHAGIDKELSSTLDTKPPPRPVILEKPQAKHEDKIVDKKSKKLSSQDQLIALLQAAAEYLLSQKNQRLKRSGSKPGDATKTTMENEGFLLNSLGQQQSNGRTAPESSETSVWSTEGTDILSTVDALLDKGELAIPYSQLGWFSQAVEVAMDGSLYVGLMVLTVLAAGAILSTALPFVTNSCIICAIIGYANVAATTYVRH